MILSAILIYMGCPARPVFHGVYKRKAA